MKSHGAPGITLLRALLLSYADIEVVGEAASGDEAVAQADRLQPDVVLMDVTMPGLNGIEATRRILRDRPNAGIVIDQDASAAEQILAEAAQQTEFSRFRMRAGRSG